MCQLIIHFDPERREIRRVMMAQARNVAQPTARMAGSAWQSASVTNAVHSPKSVTTVAEAAAIFTEILILTEILTLDSI